MMSHAIDAEKNARLLYRLKEQFQAKDFGSITGFFEVSDAWRCPCCFRSKPEIARLDKNGNLLCAIVGHHDHFEDLAGERLWRPGTGFDYEAASVVRSSFSRFECILICQDCNVAEPAAKVIADAPRAFSFSPHEIAGFIKVRPNTSHAIDPERAIEIYQALVPSMQMLAARLRATSGESNEGDWESAGAAAWRVLKGVRKDMKEAAE